MLFKRQQFKNTAPSRRLYVARSLGTTPPPHHTTQRSLGQVVLLICRGRKVDM